MKPYRCIISGVILFIFLFPFNVFNALAQTLTEAEKEQLQTELNQVLQEEQQAQASLATAQSQSSSLQNTINTLNAKIKVEQLDIQAKNLTIQTLGENITDTQNQIDSLGDQIQNNTQDIEGMFRQLQQADSTSLLEIILSNQTISGAVEDTNNLELLQQDLDTLSAELSDEEASSTVAKGVLVTKQNAATDALYAIQQEQDTLKTNQDQQKQLLSISKSNEKAYSAAVAAAQKEADAINAKLFALAGGSNPINFGEAYQYALTAQKATGVDPAFLLAILTQESNLGTDQGNCYLANDETGAGVSVKTGAAKPRTMSPTRDVPPFLTITSDLGVDPHNTVVSCWQPAYTASGNPSGWGGAMGPAQFIASTWMGLVNDLDSELGITGMPNPWNPEDAFTASATYLSDLGASEGGYTAEMKAACRYYGSGGSSCSYGSSVMALASTIQQTEINKLQGL